MITDSFTGSKGASAMGVHLVGASPPAGPEREFQKREQKCFRLSIR